ncbi:MAG TPA: peptidyl-prolyl cis-trans isomerase [Candidatus Sulfotelmatobacter sp.]|jgi:peptidyl-prolyl cis-trans isomerase SurA|nr:peptidyl-prolyl cis-trans isomerase [Candidatus Sulfotelmatobacter sp.]
MKYKLPVTLLLAALTLTVASAQVASHAPTGVATTAASATAPQASPQQFSVPIASVQVNDKPVARVNGAVLTDRDLLREMYAIFPYARQHNGFPKTQEAAIRQGALEMIIFEELVYQEAERRKLTISPAKLDRAEADFRKQFDSPDQYQQYLQSEMKGSEKNLRQQIRRSLMIEQLLKNDVEDRSAVSAAELKAYYDKNPARFTQPESFTFQSISVVPPLKPTAAQAKEAQKKAQDALSQAKATKGYEDFGLLAEKISQDDYRVNMGDHKVVGRDKLPPQVLKALATMQPGQVSGLIQIESAYTIIRLNAHEQPRKKSLQEVKADLKVELQKSKYEKLRSGLAKQLRAKAKVEEVG